MDDAFGNGTLARVSKSSGEDFERLATVRWIFSPGVPTFCKEIDRPTVYINGLKNSKFGDGLKSDAS